MKALGRTLLAVIAGMALAFALVVAAIYFVLTMSVHTDPKAVPSTVANGAKTSGTVKCEAFTAPGVVAGNCSGV